MKSLSLMKSLTLIAVGIESGTSLHSSLGRSPTSLKMFADKEGKIIPCSIHRGGSIGLHSHKTSDDINYVISGTGKAICDGTEELLTAGCCHICKKGSEHTIINTGNEDLVLITVVVERQISI